MSKLARVRKAIAAALGMAVTLVLLVPEENIPERWRPVVGIVLALGTVLGVYQVRNDQPPASRKDLAGRVGTRVADPSERLPRRRFDAP